MAKVIIGIPNNGGSIRTNLPTSEKFDCDAYRDRAKKIKERNDIIKNEMDRREENE